MKSNQKWVNYVMMALLVIQTIIGFMTDNFVFKPEIQKWIVVSLTGIVIILNGAITHFKEMKGLVIMNITLFVGYLGGAFVDLIVEVPNISESAKVLILTILGLVSTISNTIAKAQGWLLDADTSEE